VENYRNDLKPVRRHLGGKQLQQLTKADVDSLVEWMLTAGRRSPKHHQPGSLMGRIVALVGEHPEGITAAAIRAAFPADDVHTCLSGLKRAGRVTQPRRAVYVLAPEADTAARGVKPVTVRSTLTAFGMVVQSFMDQGALPRNVVALVDRPADEGRTVTSWTAAEAEQFRESVREDRLYACWLLSLYGLRRSEVLGLKWSDLTDDGVLRIERSRVEVSGGWEFGKPKSERSKRNLPLPPELPEVLRALRMRQKTEALALGVSWSDDRLIAVREDGEPVRHDWYSAEFARLRDRAGLPEVSLKRLRNTSVSLMMDRLVPVHVVAAWHGHDPAVSLSIYSHAKHAELRDAGAALFG
jgi:integrase